MLKLLIPTASSQRSYEANNENSRHYGDGDGTTCFVSVDAAAAVAGIARVTAQPFTAVRQIPAPISGMAQPAWTPDEERLRTDWAYLEYYKVDNVKVLVAPPPQRRGVVMGSTIALGWPDTHPTFFTDNGFVGRGIGGQTTPPMLVRFQQDVLLLQPEFVHIMAGANDLAENTGLYDAVALQNNLKSTAELARTNGVHPTSVGYDLMVPIAHEAIETALTR